MYRFELRLPAEAGELAYIDELLMKTLEDWHIERFRQFHFALHEAVINAIQAKEHLEATDDDTMLIEMSLEEDMLWGAVHDSFGGISHEDRPEEHCTWCESGRGMMLMAQLVDEMTYNNNQQGGFTIRLGMNTAKKETI